MKTKTNIVLHLKGFKEILQDLHLEYKDYVRNHDDTSVPIKGFGEWSENYIIDEFLAKWSKSRTDKRQAQLEAQRIEDGVATVRGLGLPRDAILKFLHEDTEDATSD